MVRYRAYLQILLLILLLPAVGLSKDKTASKSEAAPESKPIMVQAGSADTLQVTVQIFPETFRTGERAKIHLTFHFAAGFETNADVLEIVVSVEQDNGWSIASLRRYPVQEIRLNHQILQWQDIDLTNAPLGSGVMAIHLSFLKRISPPDVFPNLSVLPDKNWRPDYIPWYGIYEPATPETTVEIPPVSVDILPDKKAGTLQCHTCPANTTPIDPGCR
jgi:hypothetical protein